MGGACSTRGRDEKCIIYLFEKPKQKDNSEDLGVDGKLI
jgi:hypothetical protein